MMLVFIVLLHSIPVFLIGAGWKSSKPVTIIAAVASGLLAILTESLDYSAVILTGVIIATWLSFVAINYSKRFAVSHRASLAMLKAADSQSHASEKIVPPQLAHPAWAFSGLPVVAIVAYLGLYKTPDMKQAAPPLASASVSASTPASASASASVEASLPATQVAAVPVTAPVAEKPAIKDADPLAQQESAAQKKRKAARSRAAEQHVQAAPQPPAGYTKASETVRINFPGIDPNSQEYRWRVEKEMLKQGR